MLNMMQQQQQAWGTNVSAASTDSNHSHHLCAGLPAAQAQAFTSMMMMMMMHAGIGGDSNSPSVAEMETYDNNHLVAGNRCAVHSSPTHPAKRRDMKSTPTRSVNVVDKSSCLSAPYDIGSIDIMNAVDGATEAIVVVPPQQHQQTTVTLPPLPPPSPAPTTTNTSNELRTLDDILVAYAEERKWFHESMPMGPCSSLDELVDQLNLWAKDRNTCGGGFAVTRETSNNSTGKRGHTRKLNCDSLGSHATRLLFPPIIHAKQRYQKRLIVHGRSTSRKLMLDGLSLIQLRRHFRLRWKMKSQ